MKLPLKRTVKFLIPGLILSLLLLSVIKNWASVSEYLKSVSAIPLVVSFLFMLCIYPQAGFAWSKVLLCYNSSIDIKKLIRIWILSNAGRYIPGAVWQYVGRLSLTKQLNIPKSTITVSLLYEVFLGILAALIWSAVIFITLPIELSDYLDSRVLIVLIVAPFTLLHPKVAKKLLQGFQKAVPKFQVDRSFKFLRLQELVFLLPQFLLNFFINGLAIYFLLQSFGQELQIVHIVTITAVYSFAWFVGFISIFAPGGVGVFEVVFIALLSLFIPITLATVVALCYRFLLIVAELIVFSMAWKLIK